MKKRLFIGTGILLIIMAFFLFKGNGQEDKYKTAVVDRGDILEKITATGTINPVSTNVPNNNVVYI